MKNYMTPKQRIAIENQIIEILKEKDLKASELYKRIKNTNFHRKQEVLRLLMRDSIVVRLGEYSNNYTYRLNTRPSDLAFNQSIPFPNQNTFEEYYRNDSRI